MIDHLIIVDKNVNLLQTEKWFFGETRPRQSSKHDSEY